MKPHVTLVLKSAPYSGKLPHWTAFIRDKSLAVTSLSREIDRLMQQYGIRFWAGSEYQRQGNTWNESERVSGLDRVVRLVFQKDQPVPPALIAAFQNLASVEKVRRGAIAKADLPPTVAKSFSRNTSNWAHSQIGLTALPVSVYGDPSVTVAVLDTGVDLSHPELKDYLLPGYDFVDILSGAQEFFGDKDGLDEEPDDDLVGHGTHVAGIIAAQGLGMPAGVAKGCKILPVRVLGSVKSGDSYVGAGLVDNINNGIKWAVDQGADVINMSLGIRHEGGGLPHEEAIQYAENKGVTVIAASGNDGSPELYYPGALETVISVGANDLSGNVTTFTTYGKVTCTAPGDRIWSSHVNDGYAFASGTSQAAPFVAGTVALLYSLARQMGQNLGPSQVRYLIKHTSDKPQTSFRSQKGGYGRINVPDALSLLRYKLESKRN